MFHTSVTKLSLENQSLDVQYRCILFLILIVSLFKASLGRADFLLCVTHDSSQRKSPLLLAQALFRRYR